jgi:sarcosine oxidase subunit gamma
MANVTLAAQPAVEHWGPRRLGRPGEAEVAIAQLPQYALATVIARKGTQTRLAARVAEVFGCELPEVPRRVAAGPLAFAWAGPGRWLASTQPSEAWGFEAQLRRELADYALISDQSDALVVVGIRGPKAREALAKGLPIDLSPREFAPGQVAITVVAHMGVTLWQLDTAPTYELVMLRSYAASFCQGLVDAAAEFGLRILAHEDWTVGD